MQALSFPPGIIHESTNSFSPNDVSSFFSAISASSSTSSLTHSLNTNKQLTNSNSNDSNESKSSYDDTDTANYFEDKQHVYNGTEVNPEFSNRHVLSKAKEKSLKTDLKAAGFPPEIVMKADEIFSQMNSGLKRGIRRKQLMFFCVQCAYNEMRIPEDPNRLAAICGITSSEISKAYSMCSPSKVGYKPASIFWKPEDYLRLYFKRILDLDIISFNDDVLDEVKKICDEVMNKSIELKDEKPQAVAAAVLVFYLQLHNCVLEKKKYVEIFNKSDMSIQKVKNKVATAYNV
jgi:transcription initiation factor TFIIIB Brf1 subunit/transcription initiation factor TFIIB